jgi:hypothetical protein
MVVGDSETPILVEGHPSIQIFPVEEEGIQEGEVVSILNSLAEAGHFLVGLEEEDVVVVKRPLFKLKYSYGL